MTCFQVSPEVQYPNLNRKDSPSGQAAAADTAPGQEGLADHM